MADASRLLQAADDAVATESPARISGVVGTSDQLEPTAWAGLTERVANSIVSSLTSHGHVDSTSSPARSNTLEAALEHVRRIAQDDLVLRAAFDDQVTRPAFVDALCSLSGVGLVQTDVLVASVARFGSAASDWSSVRARRVAARADAEEALVKARRALGDATPGDTSSDAATIGRLVVAVRTLERAVTDAVSVERESVPRIDDAHSEHESLPDDPIADAGAMLRLDAARLLRAFGRGAADAIAEEVTENVPNDGELSTALASAACADSVELDRAARAATETRREAAAAVSEARDALRRALARLDAARDTEIQAVSALSRRQQLEAALSAATSAELNRRRVEIEQHEAAAASASTVMTALSTWRRHLLQDRVAVTASLAGARRRATDEWRRAVDSLVVRLECSVADRRALLAEADARRRDPDVATDAGQVALHDGLVAEARARLRDAIDGLAEARTMRLQLPPPTPQRAGGSPPRRKSHRSEAEDAFAVERPYTDDETP